MSEDTVHGVARKLSNGMEVPDPLSLNLYTYAHNNPIMYQDPSGNIAITTLILIASIVVGTIAASHTAYQSYEYTGQIDWNATLHQGLSWFMLSYTLGMSSYGIYLDYCAYRGITPVTNVKFNANAQVNSGSTMQGGQAYSADMGTGNLTGKLDGLTQAERTMVNDLLKQGKNVEIVPRSNVQGVQTPDFKINGVSTELKTLTGTSLNTPVTRIQEAFKQGKNALLDARGNPNITATEIETIFKRIEGIYKGGIPGAIEIWTNNGIFRR